jgi:hypothetical protein
MVLALELAVFAVAVLVLVFVVEEGRQQELF